MKVIKPRGYMAMQVSHTKEERYGILVGKSRQKRSLGNLSVDG
jgi:hypothetical protein